MYLTKLDLSIGRILVTGLLILGANLLLCESGTAQQIGANTFKRPLRIRTIVVLPDEDNNPRTEVVTYFVPPDRVELRNEEGEPSVRIIGEKYYMNQGGGKWRRVTKETFYEIGLTGFPIPKLDSFNMDQVNAVKFRPVRSVFLRGKHYRIYSFAAKGQETVPIMLPHSDIKNDESIMSGTVELWVRVANNTVYKMKITAKESGSDDPPVTFTMIYEYAPKVRIPIPRR